MFLPWVGLLEQVRLADVFIHYDDVQLPNGRSFMSRVQVKTPTGVSWLTAPLDRHRSRKLINETWFVREGKWRHQHLQTLRHCYARAQHFDEMFELASDIYRQDEDNLARFNCYAVERIGAFLGLRPKFVLSSQTGIDGTSTERLLAICQRFGASKYVTGLGALQYLDHDMFQSAGIAVEYMVYEKKPYLQMFGEFTPFVTVLDAIANCGRRAADLLCSKAVYWKDYVNESS
jgi:hypothetical protein